jgi:putative ABC transport system substrate-binding protein
VRRREFITLVGGTVAAWPVAASAQQPMVPVIGFLDGRSPEAVAGRLRAFRQGLQETGYVEGENVAIMYRWAENRIDRLPELASDLVRRTSRVAVLVSPADSRRTESTIGAVEAAARTMALQIQVFNADTSREIETAFDSIGPLAPDALFIGTTPFLNVRNVQLAMLASFHRLPATHSERDYAEAGGLMSYGSNIANAFHQTGAHTGRILKGAKPADLPVVQSSKLDLVINAATARMLGLTVPPSLLAIADEVIE